MSVKDVSASVSGCTSLFASSKVVEPQTAKKVLFLLILARGYC